MARRSLQDLGRAEVALTRAEALAVVGLLEALTDDASRELAVTLTINILTSDGVLPDSEMDHLRDLKDRLALTDEQYDRARSAAH